MHSVLNPLLEDSFEAPLLTIWLMSIFVSALQELELQHGGPQDHQRHEDRAGVLGDRHQHPADQTHAERLNTHPGHRRDPDLIILTL